MGTTLDAIVEVREPGHQSWWRAAKWSLGKVYDIMRAIHEQATPDWPLDVRDRRSPRNDFRRYWMDGNIVLVGVTEPSLEWRALQASLGELVKGAEVRVLYLMV